jgi:hypothetical protein
VPDDLESRLRALARDVPDQTGMVARVEERVDRLRRRRRTERLAAVAGAAVLVSVGGTVTAGLLRAGDGAAVQPAAPAPGRIEIPVSPPAASPTTPAAPATAPAPSPTTAWSPAPPPPPSTAPAPPAASAPEPVESLAFRDDFDGTELDGARWAATQNGSGSVAASVSGGELDLHNYRVTALGPPAGYGRYEARLRASPVGSTTSARLEILGEPEGSRPRHITVTLVPGEVRYALEGGTVYTNGKVDADVDDFLVITIDWSPQGVVFSVDGAVVAGGPDDTPLPDPGVGPATLQLVSEGLPLEVDRIEVSPG